MQVLLGFQLRDAMVLRSRFISLCRETERERESERKRDELWAEIRGTWIGVEMMSFAGCLDVVINVL